MEIDGEMVEVYEVKVVVDWNSLRSKIEEIVFD